MYSTNLCIYNRNIDARPKAASNVPRDLKRLTDLSVWQAGNILVSATGAQIRGIINHGSAELPPGLLEVEDDDDRRAEGLRCDRHWVLGAKR